MYNNKISLKDYNKIIFKNKLENLTVKSSEKLWTSLGSGIQGGIARLESEEV